MYFSHSWILDQDAHRHIDSKGIFRIHTWLSSCCILNDEEQGDYSPIHFYKELTLFVKASLSHSIFIIIPHFLMSLHYELSV